MSDQGEWTEVKRKERKPKKPALNIEIPTYTYTGVPSECPYERDGMFYENRGCDTCGRNGKWYKVCPLLKRIECQRCDELEDACGTYLLPFEENHKSDHYHHTVNDYCPCVFNVAYIRVPNTPWMPI